VVDVRNDKGETPLMAAAKSNQVDTMHTLLQHGANANAAESHRDTALMMCADTPDSLDAAEVLIKHGGLGITGFCRRANHQRGRAAVAALIAEYFMRKETDAEREQMKRKEMDRCLKTRAAQSFVLDDTVCQHTRPEQ
jgi:ankyrin repeat protein